MTQNRLESAGKGLWKGKGRCPAQKRLVLSSPIAAITEVRVAAAGMLSPHVEDRGPEGLLDPPVTSHEQEMLLY